MSEEQEIDYKKLWEEFEAMCKRKGYHYHLPGSFSFFNTKTGDIIELIHPVKKQVKLHSRSIPTDVKLEETEE